MLYPDYEVISTCVKQSAIQIEENKRSWGKRRRRMAIVVVVTCHGHCHS